MFIFEPMGTSELFELLTSRAKWYAGMKSKTGFHNAQSANRIKARFNKGTLPEKTLEVIFNHFGYVKNQVTWRQEN